MFHLDADATSLNTLNTEGPQRSSPCVTEEVAALLILGSMDTVVLRMLCLEDRVKMLLIRIIRWSVKP